MYALQSYEYFHFKDGQSWEKKNLVPGPVSLDSALEPLGSQKKKNTKQTNTSRAYYVFTYASFSLWKIKLK